MCALDLAEVLLGHNERELAQDLLSESQQRVLRLNGDPDLVRALDIGDISMVRVSDRWQLLASRWIPEASEIYPMTHPDRPPPCVNGKNFSVFA